MADDIVQIIDPALVKETEVSVGGLNILLENLYIICMQPADSAEKEEKSQPLEVRVKHT